jgi:hypothetical protein
MSASTRTFANAALTLGAACMLASACSPVFNWREVPLPGGQLVALMPCKPDRAERQLPLGNQTVLVSMAGCEAGGATFAVAQATAADTAQAQAWMKAWRQQAYAQWAGASVEESPAVVAQAALEPAPLRLDTKAPAARPGDEAPQAALTWFARGGRDGSVVLYQATVLGKPSAPDASETFFAGLRLAP